MSAISNALTTEQRIKDNLGITVSDLDTVIKRYMYDATKFLQSMCSRTSFKRATFTSELYNSDGSNMLILRNAPVVSIASIKENIGTQATPTLITMSADNYTIDYATGIVYFYSAPSAGISNIEVTYTAGYLIDFTNEFDDTLHTLPYELTDLCERLVTKKLKRRESEGKSTETFNGSTITWGDLLEEYDKTIIANYKRAYTG